MWFIILFCILLHQYKGFPGSSVGKDSACNAGDPGLIPGLRRSSGGEHVNPFLYSCLENPHAQRSLAGYSPWDHKELETTELLTSAQCINIKCIMKDVLI